MQPNIITAAIIVLALAGAARATTCTWTGAWSTAPSNGDTIVIASGTNLAWTNGMPATVASWNQQSSYTGTTTFYTAYGTNGLTNFMVSGDVVLAGGTWTHGANTGGETNRLRVSVGGNLLISNAVITADMRGYSAANGPGKGIALTQGTGGAYGGAAADYYGTNPNLNTYGSITAPTNLGSGAGTSGGGAILLTVAGTTTVASAGMITANGGSADGAGSGGSIYLTTGWLIGSGTIQANGGNKVNSTAGGGGRVAIILTGADADFSAWTGTNSAYSGGVGGYAAAGTVYRKTQAGVSTLIIDNNGRVTSCQVSTLMPPNALNLNSFSIVVITNKGILGVRGDTMLDFTAFNPTAYGPTNSYIAIDSDTNVTYPANWTIAGYTLYMNNITPNKPVNVTIGTNGVLSSYPNQNYTTEVYKLTLTISGNLTVMSNGMITANACGYGSVRGPGKGGSAIQGDGGAYGGAANGTNANANLSTYGSITAPTNMGSGAGAAGGGAILLTVAGTTTVASAGTITANGGPGDGAGSGGSIYLTTGRLTGSGTIQANGGDKVDGSAGGGGRVAIILTGADADFSSWTGTNSACSGGVGGYAAAGTVYRTMAGVPAGAGTVIVDNRNTATNRTYTSLPAFTNSTESLKYSQWVARNKGRIGMLTNASIASLSISSNSYLDLAGMTLRLASLAITNKIYPVGIYTVGQLGSLVADSSGGSGKVEVLAPGTVLIIR